MGHDFINVLRKTWLLNIGWWNRFILVNILLFILQEGSRFAVFASNFELFHIPPTLNAAKMSVRVHVLAIDM